MVRKRALAILLLTVVALGGVAGFGFMAGLRVANAPSPALASQLPGPETAQQRWLPAQAGTPQELEEEFAVFWDVWQIIERDFFGEVDRQAMIRGAIRGMVKALGDPYTQYLDPRHTAILREDDTGRFEVIGATVDMVDGRLAIVDLVEGGPAERAGLRPGDVVLKIDGVVVDGMDLLDAVSLVRGPKGSTVVLTVQREGIAEPFDVTLVREEIVLPSISSRMLGNGIAYLAIRSFNSRTVHELTQSLRKLEEKEAQALILDLRGNPGGFLDVAVEVVSRFIDEGPALWWEEADGTRYPILVKQRPTYDWPLIVLVDQGSASAAEIMAGAIQDADRGILVGTRTFGKGSVQNVHQLRDGGSLRVTTAHWLTRDGYRIQGVGLEPDVIVEQKPDFPDTDFQLEFAKRLLYNRIMRYRSLPQE